MNDNKTVLIIDDEDWFFEPTLEKFEYEGITYDFCRTGFDGLQKFEIRFQLFTSIGILDFTGIYEGFSMIEVIVE